MTKTLSAERISRELNFSVAPLGCKFGLLIDRFRCHFPMTTLRDTLPRNHYLKQNVVWSVRRYTSESL